MTTTPPTDDQADDLRLDIPHSARMYDYYLGGKTNYEPDRELARKTMEMFPDAPIGARENRLFINRAVRYLVAEAGIRQFLDIGTGIPTSPNLHEVAQGEDPTCRVVYADNDPLVLAHARALMASTPEGATTYIHADLRDPDALLGSAELRRVLDLSRPVALSLIAVLHFVPDADDPWSLVARYLDALPAGSHLVITHATMELLSGAQIERVAEIYRKAGIQTTTRSLAQVERFFTGLELVEPGVGPLLDWRPDGNRVAESHNQVPGFAGVGRKP